MRKKLDNRVTVVLNGYKRSEASQSQYDAYRKQSVGTPEFLFWGNMPEGVADIPFNKHVVDNCTSAICNKNLGVWARFAYALNAQTPFICIVDDDTIPGEKWLENCIDTIYEINKPAVLTTRGVKLKNNRYPEPDSYDVYGWCKPNENTEKVDFGGHCWFFHKSLLKLFWFHAPDVLPLNYGEDIHISYSSLLGCGAETFVPKHPENKCELWGSLRESALHYGEDKNATSRNNQASIGMYKYIQHILQKGYTPVVNRENKENEDRQRTEA